MLRKKKQPSVDLLVLFGTIKRDLTHRSWPMLDIKKTDQSTKLNMKSRGAMVQGSPDSEAHLESSELPT